MRYSAGATSLDTNTLTALGPLQSDIAAINRMYLLLARDLARLGPDVAEVCGGIPRGVVPMLAALSIADADRVCAAVGSVLLVRARWPADTWGEVLTAALSHSQLPIAALVAAHE